MSDDDVEKKRSMPFFDVKLMAQRGAQTHKSEIYTTYVKYCDKNGLSKVNDVSFFKNLVKFGIDTRDVARPYINGRQVHALNNVALKPENAWGLDDGELEAPEGEPLPEIKSALQIQPVPPHVETNTVQVSPPLPPRASLSNQRSKRSQQI